MAAAAYTPGTCANCDSPAVTLKRPLFCCEQCKQAAGLVRYVRGCRRDGRDSLPDVREAIEMRMAMVLSGGYDPLRGRVPPEVRAEVFRRADGRCESCGRELDLDRSTGELDAIATIQHVAGSSNDASNLKAFCRRCNMADAQSHFVPVEHGSPQEELVVELVRRWQAPEPLRLCDDDESWETAWRQLAREAKAAIGG